MMNDKDLLRLMQSIYPDTKCIPPKTRLVLEAVVADERERCAKLLERGIDLSGLNRMPDWQKYTADLLTCCAAGIRATP